ncbi:MAG: response regulator transcription factor [Nitrospirae bacterium]|nr:MAG: response regulator transcription factor [Nitrospirota bacterium]
MNRKSILLVEDDALIRETTKLILETKYNVLDAQDSAEATVKLRENIDLALIDYILPGYNGFELLKEIRKVKPMLPVIIMTGYGTEQIAIKAFRTGVTDYIKKPLDILYLMNKISELLGEDADIKDIENKYFKSIENRDEFIMEGIAKYMEEKHMEDMPREKILDIAMMNRDKFCKLFKKRFGQPFTSHLQNIRLKHAVELLKNLDLNISEIARFVGFGSVVHFERVFKGEYELSPREYRKKLKKEN